MYSGQNFNKHILVAPLDWGLGHATRCIPIIRQLLAMGCRVSIATSGNQEVLLRTEFPGLNFIHLPGYGVSYGKRGVMLRLLRQLPVIRRHIFTEHAWLQQAQAQYQWDGIISDNRYGLYSSTVPSVLITHQLALQLPGWASFFKQGIQHLLYRHIEHFAACWIPDLPDAGAALAGAMSHPPVLPSIPVRYIGWLSRFEPPTAAPVRTQHVLISLSGPEPQRQILEANILAQARLHTAPIWLVRGLPGTQHVPDVPEGVTIWNHLPADAMREKMLTCRLMISRSGYSTLMDAMLLGTPLACIPTPGQTEQEYLAKRLPQMGLALRFDPHTFQLQEIIAANPPAIQPFQANAGLLSTALQEWLSTL